MSEKDIIGLLFHAGFSTSQKVTDVSGRGVGLDVVKSKIESLSGEVEVKSKLGEGSTWIIRLPLTLAIIQALMVIVGGEKYAISLGSIQTIEDINPAEIKLVGNNEVINLRGNVIPLVRLSKELLIPVHDPHCYGADASEDPRSHPPQYDPALFPHLSYTVPSSCPASWTAHGSSSGTC